MTSEILQVLLSHQPRQMLFDGGPHTTHLECQGRGCFFVTHGGDLMWDEFAHHQTDMLKIAGIVGHNE